MIQFSIVFLISVVYLIIAIVSIVMGGLVDIFDKTRTHSAFALSLLFVFFEGIGYAFTIGYIIARGIS